MGFANDEVTVLLGQVQMSGIGQAVDGADRLLLPQLGNAASEGHDSGQVLGFDAGQKRKA